MEKNKAGTGRRAAWFIAFMIIVFPIIPIVIMIIMT